MSTILLVVVERDAENRVKEDWRALTDDEWHMLPDDIKEWAVIHGVDEGAWLYRAPARPGEGFGFFYIYTDVDLGEAESGRTGPDYNEPEEVRPHGQRG